MINFFVILPIIASSTTSCMPLDRDLFTLSFLPRKDIDGSPAIDLVNVGTDEPLYTWIVDNADKFSFDILDAFTQTKLCSCTEVSHKLRTINLLNPESSVDVKSTGLINWEQSFKFEKETYSWRRDLSILLGPERSLSLYMIRKPDPDWKIASYKPGKNSFVEIYDHNIQREDISDRKGLELVVLASLCSFVFPFHFATHISPARALSSTSMSNASSSSSSPPQVPDKVDIPIEPNVLVVDESSGLSDDMYIAQSIAMLKDPALALLVIRANTTDNVSRAIKIASEIKLTLHRINNEDLRQYLIPLDEDDPKSLSRIKLGSSAGRPNKKPPTAIKIYLSRVSLDELDPKVSNVNEMGIRRQSSSRPFPTPHNLSSSAPTIMNPSASAPLRPPFRAPTHPSDPGFRIPVNGRLQRPPQPQYRGR